jgi:hypothetical protein
MLGLELRSKLGRRIDGRVEVPAEPALGMCQRLHDILERGVPDDHQIDIALPAKFTARPGAEHERDQDPLAEWGEPLTKHVHEPDGLRKHPLQLREDRRVSVGLEVHLAALDGAPQQPSERQLLQLALNRTCRGTGVPRDLTKVVRLVGMAQQPREYAPAGASEKDRSRIPVDSAGGSLVARRDRSSC